MMKMAFLIMIQLLFALPAMAQSSGSARGVDFRVSFLSGQLNFMGISGIERQYKGIGSELQTSLYLYEKNRYGLSFFIASRVMSWSAQEILESEYDDLHMFSIAPGLEFRYGPLYLQASSSSANANSYYISSASKGQTFTVSGPVLSGGLNVRLGRLGIGFGMSQMNTKIPGDILGLSTDSAYVEKSYSFNLIYFMGITPGRFFKELFKK